MRIATAALALAYVFFAGPSFAVTTATSSWEGAATESQKFGPYSRARGPLRGGRYIISRSGRQDRPLWRYHWNPVLVR